MNKNLIKALALVVILMPLIALAQNQYPNAPLTQTTITQNSKLGDVVKYVATWAIVIGGIIVFGSLIAAGIQYISSTGDPSKMKEARDRILGSFIGVLILLGSYLILSTINPQLTVLEVEPTVIKVTAGALNKSGTSAVKDGKNPGGGEGTVLQRSYKKAKDFFGGILKKRKSGSSFLNPSKGLGLISTVFAQSCPTDAKSQNEVNFPFDFDSILLLRINGKLPEKKFIAYSKNDFQGEARVIYPSEINYPSVSGDDWEGILIPKEQIFFVSDLIGEEVLDENGNKIPGSELSCNFYHPALSMKVLGTGPGIYLYNSPDSKTGDERYIDGSFDNLTSSNIDFDNQITRIGVRNDASNDYLTILFEETDFQGQFRMFFENKKRQTVAIGADGTYKQEQSTDNLGNVNFLAGTTEKVADVKKGGNKDGNVVIDEFGRVKDASSILVSQINNDPSVCQEVRLCTGPEYFGDCIVYLPAGKNIDWDLETEGVGLVKQKMPLYLPENIPNSLNVEFKKKSDDGSTIREKRTAEFADNIYSVKIKGNCLTAVFENKMSQTGFWENSGPGSNSEVFTDSVFDLNPYNVTNCRPWSGLGFWQTQSCVSSIAVFPTQSGSSGGGAGGGGGGGW